MVYTPPAEVPDPQNSQPHIVAIAHDNYYQYYIAIEKGMYMDCTDVVTAVLLLASHYVFNLSYHPKVHELLRFIQEKVSGIPSTKKRAKFRSLQLHLPTLFLWNYICV